jgi:ferrous iron transport protein B
MMNILTTPVYSITKIFGFGCRNCPYASKEELKKNIIRKRIKVALAGIPNTGKSVVFNTLTGGRAWVGNWPGTTVEKKVGRFAIDGYDISVIDLPGAYSLSPDSLDQKVARDAIVKDKPDLVVILLNATNLERSLYLAISILETGVKAVLSMNFMDVAKNMGFKYDLDKLARILHVPIIEMVAIKRKGFKELKEKIVESLENNWVNVKPIDYGKDVESYIEKLEKIIEKDEKLSKDYNSRWLAVKLLELDRDIINLVSSSPYYREIKEAIDEASIKLYDIHGKHLDALIPMIRYGKAIEIVNQILIKEPIKEKTFSDALDDVMTNYIYGVLTIIAVLYILYLFSFEASQFLVDGIDYLINHLLENFILTLPLPDYIVSLFANGVVPGVGSVIMFLPYVAFLFIGIAILEDVGYLSRIAYLLDRFLSKLGLSGKSIIPMILGFGCNVPAVMATRVIEDEKSRIITALIVPLMSCSARLPVYILFASLFFPNNVGLIVFVLYLTGVFLAVIVSFIFRKTIFRGPLLPFVIEMPPYFIPQPRNVLVKSWVRAKAFIYRAGTVILIGSIIIWIASVTGPIGYIGPSALSNANLLRDSWIGYLGRVFEPIVSPLGWDWRAAVALISGFVAKEIVISTLAVLYSSGGIFEHNLLTAFTPLTSLAYMFFVLIYVPCLATISTIKSEFGTRTALLAVVYEMTLAYLVALIIVVLGTWIGFG